MNKILAIAGLTFRAAVRSRLLLMLSVLVIAGIIGLPRLLQSDGTLSGEIRLYIQYAMGLTLGVLSIAATWSGAGAFSLEMRGRQMQLLVTRPVQLVQIWAGKWLGLMAVYVLLAGLAWTILFVCLHMTLRSDRFTDADRDTLRKDIFVARSDVLPDQVAPVSVTPGNYAQWVFTLPAHVRPNDPVHIQFKFVAANTNLAYPMNGFWFAGTQVRPDLFRVRRACVPGSVQTLSVPAPESRTLVVTYVNAEDQTPATVIFSSKDGIKLLIRDSGFAGNYLRGFLLVVARLGFFTAVGLTAGALMSFPVAVFIAFSYLLLTMMDTFIDAVLNKGWLEGMGTGIALWDGAIKATCFGINLLTPPLSRFDPLNFLPGGLLISWGLVAQALLVMVGAYGGVLMVGGMWLFRRREIGLPEV